MIIGSITYIRNAQIIIGSITYIRCAQIIIGSITYIRCAQVIIGSCASLLASMGKQAAAKQDHFDRLNSSLSYHKVRTARK